MGVQLHTTTGRWQLGLALALVPAVLWGFLPVALKLALQQMDGWTVAWFRFAGAAGVLWLALLARRGLPKVASLSRWQWLLVGIASVGLGGNYLFWMIGLQYATPATASLVIQISPLFLAAGAMLLFRETFSRTQWVGFGLLFVGLGLFSHEKVAALVQGTGEYWLGVALLVVAGFSWTFYALAQKQLLRVLPSPQIMVLVYCGAAICLLPRAQPLQILRLDPLHAWVVLFCVLNTVVAYGALAEAFDHWDASRVSAVLPLSPLFTLLSMAAIQHWFPGLVTPEPVGPAGLTGAVMVVVGAAMTALGRAADELAAAEPGG